MNRSLLIGATLIVPCAATLSYLLDDTYDRKTTYFVRTLAMDAETDELLFVTEGNLFANNKHFYIKIDPNTGTGWANFDSVNDIAFYTTQCFAAVKCTIDTTLIRLQMIYTNTDPARIDEIEMKVNLEAGTQTLHRGLEFESIIELSDEDAKSFLRRPSLYVVDDALHELTWRRTLERKRYVYTGGGP